MESARRPSARRLLVLVSTWDLINLAAIRLMPRRLTRPSVYPSAARPRPGYILTAA
ncbi:hypothetical protein [Streptomyces olivaceoviridis]|uniref:hypothetical protein n=1 Tax=Streptomyces olivaceoviridis TaxID=1921 RepID=UPI00369C4199